MLYERNQLLKVDDKAVVTIRGSKSFKKYVDEQNGEQ
jgi:hypothetical protein